MANKSVDKLKERMKKAATTDSKAKAAPEPTDDRGPAGIGQFDAPIGEGSKDRNVSAGPKSLTEKQAVAEELIAEGKAKDVEDTREETSGDERHDLVAGKELNIPPSIIQERLRMGQNPANGEPWTKEERMRYDREQEQGRQRHAQAVRESEDRMRKDQIQATIQPAVHTPISQLTETQKREMQASQDRGESPIAQAMHRDQNTDEAIGRRNAERQLNMSAEDKRRQDAGVDEDIEKEELERAEHEDDEEDEKDADEIQSELDESRSR